jgi:hypothetical protein
MAKNDDERYSIRSGAAMNGRALNSPPKSAYIFVPARSIAEDNLINFAQIFWPHRPAHDPVRSGWWRRAEPHCAVAVVHEPTGDMVGLCGGRPSEWMIAGQPYAALAICDWYVDPKHAGKLIGKRMLQHFQRPDRMMYAISISDTAVAYIQRLGWIGPHVSCLMVAPLPRFVGAALSWFRRPGALDFSDHAVAGGEPLGPLGSYLDRIESSRTSESLDHMRRGSQEWAWRLSVCGDRSYRFCVAHRAGEPAGYVAVRRMTTGRIRQLGERRAAIVTDLVAVDDDPEVLRALGRRALAIAGELRAVTALTITTNQAHRRALAATGFVSPAFPLIGRALQRRSPVFMWLPKGPGCQLRADRMALTFADAAVDLDL